MKKKVILYALGLLLACAAMEAQSWTSYTWAYPSNTRKFLSSIAVQTGGADVENWRAVGSQSFTTLANKTYFWIWGPSTSALFTYASAPSQFNDVLASVTYTAGNPGPSLFSSVGVAQEAQSLGDDLTATGLLYFDVTPVLMTSLFPIKIVSDTIGNRFIACLPSTPNTLVVFSVAPDSHVSWVTTLTGHNYANVANGFQFADMAIDGNGLYVLTTSYDSSQNATGALLYRLDTLLGGKVWPNGAWFTEFTDMGSNLKAYQVYPAGDGGAIITATNVLNDVGDRYMITNGFTYLGTQAAGWPQREYAVRTTPPSVPMKAMNVVPKGISKDNLSVYVVADRLDQGGTPKIDALQYSGTGTARFLYNNLNSNAAAGGIIASALTGTVLVAGLSGNPGSAIFFKLSAASFQQTSVFSTNQGLTELAATAFRIRSTGVPEGYIVAAGKDANGVPNYYVHAAY